MNCIISSFRLVFRKHAFFIAKSVRFCFTTCPRITVNTIVLACLGSVSLSQRFHIHVLLVNGVSISLSYNWNVPDDFRSLTVVLWTFLTRWFSISPSASLSANRQPNQTPPLPRFVRWLFELPREKPFYWHSPSNWINWCPVGMGNQWYPLISMDVHGCPLRSWDDPWISIDSF